MVKLGTSWSNLGFREIGAFSPTLHLVFALRSVGEFRRALVECVARLGYECKSNDRSQEIASDMRRGRTPGSATNVQLIHMASASVSPCRHE